MKTTLLLKFLLTAVCLASTQAQGVPGRNPSSPSAAAAQDPAGTPVTDAPSQPDWLPTETGRRAEDKTPRIQARTEKRGRLVQAADEARAFYEANPNRSEANEARRREAKNRLLAALLGTEAPGVGVLALARQVRTDTKLATKDRFEVATLEEMATRKGKKYKDHEEYLRDREGSARKLIAEFSDVPAAYEQLLQAAAMSPDPRALALAQQLIDSPAPGAVKDVAREIAQRQTLTGRTLTNVIGGQPGAAVLLKAAAHRPVVFYTWRPEDKHSIEWAKALALILPPDALVLAVNLSPDVAAANAAAQQLPGEQLYGGRGFDSPVVRRLALTAPALLYVVGRSGVLKNLSNVRDPAAALADVN